MNRAPGHTLKIKCPTWDHVEAFYARKVKVGNTLSARVPFSPRKGEVVTLALELPDEMVIAIEARVEASEPAPDGRKAAVRLEVFGLTPVVRARLERLVAEGGKPAAGAARGRPLTRPPAASEPVLPVPLPTDAPIDEVVEPLELPTLASIPTAERGPAAELLARLEALKAAPAHDVLGVRWGAAVDEIRHGYFQLVLRYHPDRFARHRSPAVALIAQEVFIHINKAYDRMRDSAVAAGQAIAAGPALLPHRGWLAGFDDIGSLSRTPPGGTASVGAALGKAAAGRTAAGPAALSVRFARRAPGEPAQLVEPAAAVAAPDAPMPAAAMPAGPVEPIAQVGSSELSAASLFDGLDDQPEAAPLDGGPLDGGPAAAGDGTGAILAAARAELERGEHQAARDRMVAALNRAPRDRLVRALYHVAQAHILAADGKLVEATSMLEAALAHDPACAEAHRAIEQLKQEHGKKAGLFKRLFSR